MFIYLPIMNWIPLFEAASKNLDCDAPLLRNILDDIACFSHCTKDDYKFDSKAQFAMGWWFFTIYVQKEFVKNAVEYMHAKDPKAKDEYALLNYVQHKLKEKQNSTLTVKFHNKRSIFTQYWTWLMR